MIIFSQDSTNKEIQLGVTSIGLVVFQNGIKINVFSWSKIVKISFKRKQFFIQLRREQVCLKNCKKRHITRIINYYYYFTY